MEGLAAVRGAAGREIVAVRTCALGPQLAGRDAIPALLHHACGAAAVAVILIAVIAFLRAVDDAIA